MIYATTNGAFTMKSFYNIVTGSYEDSGPLFQAIQCWEGLEHIKILLWKVAKNGFLTNDNKVRRGMENINICPQSNRVLENPMHCLCDYDIPWKV